MGRLGASRDLSTAHSEPNVPPFDCVPGAATSLRQIDPRTTHAR